MDIKPKKPKVINLRRKRKDRVITEMPVQIEVKEEVPAMVETPKETLPETGTFTCIKCRAKEATRELGRCKPCEVEHENLVRRLDSIPRQILERPKEEWVSKKEVKGGVTVTTYMTKQEAMLMGIRVD